MPQPKVQITISANAQKALEKIKNFSQASIRSFSKMKTEGKELDGQLEKVRQTGGKLGGAKWAPVVSITALTYASVKLIRLFADFDDTMRRVGAVTNATSEELLMMRDAAKEAGSTTRFTASQAAEGLLYLGMAGFSARQSTEALPNVLRLAAAGSTDLGRAADITTNILTGYGMRVEDLGRVNDVLVKTFTSSNSTLEELGYAFSYVGPIAKSAGLRFEETAALLGKLHDAGIKGERAGTALRGAISRLLRPVRGTGKAIEELGLEIYDSTGKIRPMTDILAELQEKGATTGQVIKLFGVEAGPGMASLIGQGADSISRFQGELNNAGGTAERVAEEMEAGLGGAMREMTSATEGLWLEIGEALAPTLQQLARDIATIVRALTNAQRETQALTVIMRPFVVVMEAVGRIVKGVAYFMGWLGAKTAQVTYRVAGMLEWIASGFKGGLKGLDAIEEESNRIMKEVMDEWKQELSGAEKQVEDLSEAADDLEKDRESEVDVKAPNLPAIESELNHVARDRTMTIHVKKVEEKQRRRPCRFGPRREDSRLGRGRHGAGAS